MKNLFYIPFLVVVALLYTKVVEDPKQLAIFQSSSPKTRAPASVEQPEVVKESCENIHSHFNSHYRVDHCF